MHEYIKCNSIICYAYNICNVIYCQHVSIYIAQYNILQSSGNNRFLLRKNKLQIFNEIKLLFTSLPKISRMFSKLFNNNTRSSRTF